MIAFKMTAQRQYRRNFQCWGLLSHQGGQEKSACDSVSSAEGKVSSCMDELHIDKHVGPKGRELKSMLSTKPNRVLLGICAGLVCAALTAAPTTAVPQARAEAESAEQVANAEALYRRAQELYQANRLDEAKALFEKVKATAGDYRQTSVYLREIANLHKGTTGQGGQGIPVPAGGGVSSSEAVSRLVVEGRRALKEGKLDAARQNFKQAIALDANNAEARRYLDEIEQKSKTKEFSPSVARLDLPGNLPKDQKTADGANSFERSSKPSLAQHVKSMFSRQDLPAAERVSKKERFEVDQASALRVRSQGVSFDSPVVASLKEGSAPSVRNEKQPAQQVTVKKEEPKAKNAASVASAAQDVARKEEPKPKTATEKSSNVPEKTHQGELESAKVNVKASALQPKDVSAAPSSQPAVVVSGAPEAVVVPGKPEPVQVAQADDAKKKSSPAAETKKEAQSEATAKGAHPQAAKPDTQKQASKSEAKTTEKSSPAQASSKESESDKKASSAEVAKDKAQEPDKTAKSGAKPAEKAVAKAEPKKSDPKVEADTLVREAQRLLKEGKREEARAKAMEAMQKDPANVEAKALVKDLEPKATAQKSVSQKSSGEAVVLPPLSATPKTEQPDSSAAAKEGKKAEEKVVASAPQAKPEQEKPATEKQVSRAREEAGTKSVATEKPTPSRKTSRDAEAELAAREKADQAEAAFQKGLAAYQDGQLDVAVQWWNYALTLVPNHPRALQYLQQTRPEYDAWVQQHQANAIELQKEATTNARLDMPVTFDTAGPKSLTEFLSALSLITDISFYVADGVDPDLRITAKFEDVPLRDALDTTLLPIGLKWTQSGEVIAITPDLKTKFFNLTPDQVARLKTLLENKTLQRYLYGGDGVPVVKNVELLLDDRENVLLVTDSQENINKVEAFLKDMQQAGPPALIYKSWKIRPEEGPKIKALVEAIVRVQGDAPYDLERKVVVDGGDLIVKDTAENIKKIEELLLDKNFIKKIENQQLQVATFNLTPREPLSDNIEQVREMAQNIVTVVKTLLYAKSSESAAAAEGRRYWYDPNTLQLTIVDYPDNLRIVSDYIRSLPTLGKKQKSEIIFLKHQTASEMSDLISRVLGLSAQEPTGGAAQRGNQITRTVSVSGGTPQEIVFRDLRLRASKINENDANDRNDDSIELIINTPTTSEERTIDEYKSEFIDDYEIAVLEVRPSGTAGQGTAKLQIRYAPQGTGVAGIGAGGLQPGAAQPGAAVPGLVPGQVPQQPQPAETGLTVETIDNMNALLIRYDDPADFAEIKSYIEQLDIPVLQVSIETKLVEVNESKAKEYAPQFSILNIGQQGVDFDNSVLNMRFAQDADEWRSPFDPSIEGVSSMGLLKGATVLNFIAPGQTPVAFTLRMLEAEGVVNVVNGPMITVENGETADFQIEQRIGVSPFGGGGASTTTTGGTTGGGTTDTGGGTTTGGTTSTNNTTNQTSTGGGYSIPTVTMSVSPNITQLGEIRLEISNLELFDIGAEGKRYQTDVNDQQSVATAPGAFDLRRRYLTTTARVNDGGTIVLGGWTGERSRKSESGVPILRNLPYVGKLFFNRTNNVTDKTTLLVFLTCHLQKP